MRLAGAGPADQHDVALLSDEAAAGEIAHQALVDRRALELEAVDVLGQRQLRDGQLYLIERACFSEISAFSRSPAKRCGSCRRLRAVARISSPGSGFASPRTGSGVLHPKEPELAHQIEDFGSLHGHVLLS